MERWSRKLQRRGYPATVRHQAIKEAMEKFERMCDVEDNGGWPIHRASEWQNFARRLDREMKVVSWLNAALRSSVIPLAADQPAPAQRSPER